MTEAKRLFLLLNIFLYTIALILALKNSDVARIEPLFTKIGLSTVNIWFRNLCHYNEELGYSKFWYYFTQILGYLSLAPCALWTALFSREMIKSGSLSGVGVDKNLMATFWLYVFATAFCILFKIFVINYGPVLPPGKTKPFSSFPSVHTVLFIIALGSSIFQIWDILGERKKLAISLTVLCSIIMAIGIFGRMICGICWFTDIIGGILISTTLILVYSFFFYA